MRFQFRGASVCLLVLIIHDGTGILWVYWFGLLMQAIPLCWLYSTLHNLEWPPIMARCSIIFAFLGSLGHFASKSLKANIQLIKKPHFLTVVLTLQLAEWRGFRRALWEGEL